MFYELSPLFDVWICRAGISALQTTNIKVMLCFMLGDSGFHIVYAIALPFVRL